MTSVTDQQAASAATRFTLRVPQTWIEFDVWRATRTGDLVRLVDERVAQAPQVRPYRSTILRGLRDLAERAERAGAVYCAAAADDLGDDGTLLASLMVFTTVGLPEPALNTVPAIAAQLPSIPRTAGSSAWREVHVVDLPAGQAVQVRGVSVLEAEAAPGAGTGPVSIPIVSLQTLVPTPDGHGVLNLVLSSPQAQVADPMLELFGAISATLAWAAPADGASA